VTRRRIDAWLLLDKPSGISSNAALQRAKRLYRAAKAGHAGTLDPLASGLLPVLFGETTKFSGLLLGSDKEYLAEVRLGVSTTTGDAEGAVIEQRPVAVSEERLQQALAQLRGPIEQVPPMHSALKYHGRALYELARQGTEIERLPRQVVIRELELQDWRGDALRLRVRCSKGTYIRSLAMDLGAALGTGAHLGSLRRTMAGAFRIADATPPAALEAMDEEARDRLLRPLWELLQDLPRLELQEPDAKRFVHGQSVGLDPGREGLQEERCQVYGPDRRLLGIGVVGGHGELRPVRLLADAAAAFRAPGEAVKTL
jgi:tRNA pseudouridine55 synthase